MSPPVFDSVSNLAGGPVSIGYAAGEDEWQISRRLGHSDPSFTKRVYTDLWESTKTEGAAKRGRLLDTGTDA